MYSESGFGRKNNKDHSPAAHIGWVLGNPALAGCGVEQPRLDGVGDPSVPEAQLALDSPESATDEQSSNYTINNGPLKAHGN